MKNIKQIFIYTLLFCLLTSITPAQDIKFTIAGLVVNNENDSMKVALDSILFENLSNGTRILFDNLPDQPDYIINLTSQEQIGTTGIIPNQMGNIFRVVKNMPGFLSIALTQGPSLKLNLSVYNVQGQKLYNADEITVQQGNTLNIKLSNSGIFLCAALI